MPSLIVLLVGPQVAHRAAPPFQEVVPGSHVVFTARWGTRAARLVSQVMPPTAILR